MADLLCYEIDVDLDDTVYCGRKCPGNDFGKNDYCKYCDADLDDAGQTVCESCDEGLHRYFRHDICLDHWRRLED